MPRTRDAYSRLALDDPRERQQQCRPRGALLQALIFDCCGRAAASGLSRPTPLRRAIPGQRGFGGFVSHGGTIYSRDSRDSSGRGKLRCSQRYPYLQGFDGPGPFVLNGKRLIESAHTCFMRAESTTQLTEGPLQGELFSRMQSFCGLGLYLRRQRSDRQSPLRSREMHRCIARSTYNAERIFPTSAGRKSMAAPRRRTIAYVINFERHVNDEDGMLVSSCAGD